MKNFRYSFCEPLNPKIIEKGKIEKSDIISIFNDFQWQDYLEQMENAEENEIFFSPSLEFENLHNNNSLEISAVGSPDDYEFYIFYKRPKMEKTWFGFREKMNDNFLSDLTNQNEKDALECLEALLENNLSYLEMKFK